MVDKYIGSRSLGLVVATLRSARLLGGPASASGVANHLCAAIAVVDVGADLNHAQRARVVGRGDLLGPRTPQAPDDGDLDSWPLRRIHAVPGGRSGRRAGRQIRIGRGIGRRGRERAEVGSLLSGSIRRHGGFGSGT